MLRYPLQQIILALLLTLFAPAAVAHADMSVPSSVKVRGVLFFSPTCPHCHEIMQNYLPPVLTHYGERLAIVAINVETAEGMEAYRAVAQQYELTRDRFGVPALVIGDRILVGSGEIPTGFRRLVDAGLAAGGIAWPNVPAVRVFVQKRKNLESAHGLVVVESTDATSDVDSAIAMLTSDTRAADRTPATNFVRDPVANSIAVIVAVIMAVILVRSLAAAARSGFAIRAAPRPAAPTLAIIGAGIAGYLAFIEMSGNPAVCGPLGHCNEVQSSSYAQVLGMPVALMGLLAYLTLVAVSLINRKRGEPVLGAFSWGIAFVGVLFSLYLTLLEPFVIGATCMWCLTSAVLITTILHLLTTGAQLEHAPSGVRVSFSSMCRNPSRGRSKRLQHSLPTTEQRA